MSGESKTEVRRRVGMKRLKNLRTDNRGSALVSVMAVAIFLSIIATTIIYISGKNYQIKANDYQNKNTFYKAEMALDEFKGALASDVSEAFAFAYGDVMTNFTNYKDGDKRNEEYRKKYCDYLYYKWTGDEDAVPYGTKMPSGVSAHVAKGGSIYEGALAFAAAEGLTNFEQYFIREDKLEAGDEKMGVVLDVNISGRVILRNIRVKYTENGYSSYICTDIAFDPPAYYMGATTPVAGAPVPASPKDNVERLYMGDYILYKNWHEY